MYESFCRYSEATLSGRTGFVFPAHISGLTHQKETKQKHQQRKLLHVLTDWEHWLASAGWWGAMMQPLMHIMESFLSDLTPPLSISSSSFSLRSVVPFFSRLPLSIYLLCLSSLHLFSDSQSSPRFHPLHFHLLCENLIFSLIFSFVRPTARFPRSWLTGSFIPPRGDRIAPSWMCVRSKRGDVPGGWGCTSEGVPAVWQCSAMWTQAWTGTSSLTPGLLI